MFRTFKVINDWFLIFTPNHFLSNSVLPTSTSCKLPDVGSVFIWGVPQSVQHSALCALVE